MTKFDLVFEGGGAKGMVFTGALREFERRGHTFDRLMGTSAGAIMATFLAAGFDSTEMIEALSERVDGKPVFTRFMGDPESFDQSVISASATREWLENADIPIVPPAMEEQIDDWIVDNLLKSDLYRHIFSFVERGGWYSADGFLEWIRRKLNEGTYKGEPRRFSEMTLEEFYEKTGTDLTLLAADVTGNRLRVLNHRTAPNLPLVWGVRMSMSVPLLWQEVIWDSDWGTYRDAAIAGNAIVDGGLLSNFPIELFITEDPMWMKIMGPKKENALIGMLIDETIQVPGVDSDPDKPSSSIGGMRTVSRLKGLVDTVTQARDKGVITEYNQFVVRLPAKHYGTTEFDMPDWKRNALIEAGEKTMIAYLDEIGDQIPSTSPAFEALGFYDQADEVAARILGEP
ncbi:MAG: patatin-like phospholipase family protein [Candidatus Promineifilaceae bacterium]|jgi:NTE family protein